MTARAALRYEGKAKKVWETDDADLCIVEYTDSATAFNGEKRATLLGKGALNNQISALFMELVAAAGVPTHFVRGLDEHSQLVRRVDIVPLEVVVRNVAAGSLAKRVGCSEGTVLPRTVVELYYKRDDLGDPLLNRSHIAALDIATPDTLDELERMARVVNDTLVAHLRDRGVTLVDFKLEFGHTADGTLILADEISPDTCRFWDSETGEKLDKDVFRRDLGDAVDGYGKLLERLTGTAAGELVGAAR